MEAAANRLGNRPATCRKFYIHPKILLAYEDGSLRQTIDRCRSQTGVWSPFDLSREERAVLTILKSPPAAVSLA